MEFRPGDLPQDPHAERPHPYADYADLKGRWFLIPLVAIIAGLALVELFAALTGGLGSHKATKTQRKD